MDQNQDSDAVALRWPDAFTSCDQDYIQLLHDIKIEEHLQNRWQWYYSDMERWFVEEQARCAMPTVADVAEHWSHDMM